MAELSLTPLSEHIGGRIDGIALASRPSDADVRWIYECLLDRKVLVLRGQTLDAGTFRAFASRYGSLQRHVLRKYRHDDFPDLSWLTNVAKDGSVDSFGVRRATTWHSDGSYTQDPPALGMLFALEVPSKGGGTLFADMCNAYDSLDSVTRAKVDELTGLHCHGAGPGGDMYDGTLDGDQEEGFKDAVHPAVKTHPETGRKVIYINATHTRKFAQLDNDESVRLVEDLVAHATSADNIYVHEWAPGDLLIWDQRAVMHRGAGDYPPEQRRVKLRAIVQTLHGAPA